MHALGSLQPCEQLTTEYAADAPFGYDCAQLERHDWLPEQVLMHWSA